MEDNARQIAEVVREACLQAALGAYEEAGFSGLCADGRWECAVEALRRLDLGLILTHGARERNVRKPPALSGPADED